MASISLIAALSLVSLLASIVLYSYFFPGRKLKGLAYIIRTSTTHVRFLPIEARHSFTYPTLSFLVSLRDLEERRLTLGWSNILFAYSPRYFALTALSPESYLYDDESSKGLTILGKLHRILDERGLIHLSERIGDIWTMTMPSFLGFAGVNPLTVHFCYDKALLNLVLVALEVHNTFGERHVYLLEVGVREDEDKPKGFTHQWTFPRTFHVSPFNDRSGTYTCSIVPPLYPPNHPHWNLPRRPNAVPNFHSEEEPDAPKPVVRLHLNEPSSSDSFAQDGSDNEKGGKQEYVKKLSAIQRTVSSIPLSSSSLMLALIRTPLILFLTFPRIAYEAFKLHYRKGLDVYARPEPVPALTSVEKEGGMKEPWNATGEGDKGENGAEERMGGTIGYQEKGWIENFAERRVNDYLTTLSVPESEPSPTETLVVEFISTRSSSSSLSPPMRFVIPHPHPPSPTASPEVLRITYRSPRVFTLFILSPAPAHILLAGVEGDRITGVRKQDRELFCRVFDGFSKFGSGQGGWSGRVIEWLRGVWARGVREEDLASVSRTSSSTPLSSSPPPSYPHQRQPSSIPLVAVLALILFGDWLERTIFTLLGARFVEGDEPWGIWGRAARSIGMEMDRDWVRTGQQGRKEG